MDERQDWQTVLFAGGGCRCFWQLGFWAAVAPALELAPRFVGAVSAGAAMACAALAGRTEAVVADFKARAAANERNFYPGNLLRREPAFPQEAIYRWAILTVLDREALARLHAGPEIEVVVTRPPSWAVAGSCLPLAAVARMMDKRSGDRVHARWGPRFGFRGEWISVRQCATPEEVADLILHSSCTPPATPWYRRDDRPVLDGCVAQDPPFGSRGPGDGTEETLVLLTRHQPQAALPRLPGRTYVAPSEPIGVAVWDYTSPEKVQQTFDLGRRDGERFARERGA
jgi:predicted acylesterase/phospholipase RssA